MKLRNLILVGVFPLLLLGMAACSDDKTLEEEISDEQPIPEVTLSDISVDISKLAFDADGGSTTVKVVAEEVWTSVCSDWLTVTPSSGEAGETEVVIVAPANMIDGLPGPSRSGEVTFTGEETESEAVVIVSQYGDAESSITDLAGMSDDAAVYVTGLTVTSLFTGGFAVTAEGLTVLVFSDETVNVGNEVAVKGTKSTMGEYPIVNADTCYIVSDASVSAAEPEDITETIGFHSFSQFELVRVQGVTTESGVTVIGSEVTVEIYETATDVSTIDENHLSYLTGYYVGTSSDKVELFVTAVDDIGLIEEKVLFEENWDWLEKFEAWFDSSLNGSTDSVARGSDIQTDRVDASAYKRDDGVTMLRYMLDTLNYHFYVFDSGSSYTSSEVYYDRDGYTPLWGNGGTYYMGCSNKRARVYVLVPKFEVPTENTLSITLSVDVARKGNLKDAVLRFDFLTEELESKASRSIDIYSDVSENYAWKNYTFDITNIDFEEAPIFGFGSGVFEYTGNDATFWLDNIKITWVGY